MSNMDIYQELQLIDEFEANFNPNAEVTARKRELLTQLLDGLQDRHEILWDNDRLVQAFAIMREIKRVKQMLANLN